MKSLNIIISGKLNKVGFRYFIKQRAAKFNITGSVRYKTPNSIFVEACGNSDELDEFLKYCQLGVPFSEIEKIEVSETQLKDYQTFEVID
ncbi:MAG: acylphosphatase [Bacteroidales bacterium]|nr:acylphosphatase [Bacteroidales bacterium]